MNLVIETGFDTRNPKEAPTFIVGMYLSTTLFGWE
jgi:hypothetical protein